MPPASTLKKTLFRGQRLFKALERKTPVDKTKIAVDSLQNQMTLP
jgi:hypothetical protein